MMKQIIHNTRTVWRLLPYAMQFKTMTIFSIFFAIIGFILKFAAIATPVTFSILGDWFLLLIPMYLVQMVQSAVALSGLTQSSGIKKAALTSAAALLYEGFLLVSFTLIVVLDSITVSLYPETKEAISYGMLLSLIIMIIFTVYNILAYRYYLVSTVFIIVIALFIGMGNGFRIGAAAEGVFLPLPEPALSLPFSTYAVVGYVVTVLCGILYYILSLVFYKKPLSERVFRSTLRKYGV